MLVDDRMTIATPEGVDVELVLAGLGSRFLARLLDTFIQALGIFALAIIAGVGGLVGSGSANGFIGAFFAVGVFAVVWVYDVAFETLGSGRTPGKRAAGIRVVGMRGEPITFRAAVIRNVLRIIELLTLYLPAVFSILLTRHDQRLGDLAAGTLVIRERFGGRTSNTDAQNPWSSISVRPAAVATWDVSGITPDETQTVGRFLDRRLELPWHIRGYLANELVQRLAPRITGAPENAHPEFVLEGIVVAKHARA